MTLYHKGEEDKNNIQRLVLLLNKDDNRYKKAYHDGTIPLDKYFLLTYNMCKLMDAIESLAENGYDFKALKEMEWKNNI